MRLPQNIKIYLTRSFLKKILLSILFFTLPFFENTTTAATNLYTSHFSIKKKRSNASKSKKKNKSSRKKKSKNKRKKTRVIKSKPSNKVNFPFR